MVLTTPKTSSEKLALSVIEMQQMPDTENSNSKEEASCLKWPVYNGRRKVCVKFQTDTDQLNIIVYRYRNKLCLKDNKGSLKMTEYQSLLAKRVYLLSYIEYSTSGALYWMEQLFMIKTNSVKNGSSLSGEHYPIVPGIETVI